MAALTLIEERGAARLRALDESEGSVSRAARLLGMEHQSLIYLLGARHKQLAGKRTPAKKRLKSIIRKPDKD